MRKDVLNQIVAILIAGNVDERNARPVSTALTNAIEVAGEELGAANLETLLDNFGSELVGAVLGSISNDMVDRTAAVTGRTVLTDVLNAPVSKLAVSNNVDIGEDLFNARPLPAVC